MTDPYASIGYLLVFSGPIRYHYEGYDEARSPSALRYSDSYDRIASGSGIDRHLLGLRLMMRPDAGERAALFEDPLFERSQEWKLSTSALSAGKFFRGTGFGTPYHSGYGINYLSGLDIIKFGIESKRSCAETSTAAFQREITSALREMRRVCSPEPTYPDPPAVARL
jgi:carnitine O-acetyltransferase